MRLEVSIYFSFWKLTSFSDLRLTCNLDEIKFDLNSCVGTVRKTKYCFIFWHLYGFGSFRTVIRTKQLLGWNHQWWRVLRVERHNECSRSPGVLIRHWPSMVSFWSKFWFLILLFSVEENPTNTKTKVQLIENLDGVPINLDERTAQCDLSFSIKMDHVLNQTTILGSQTIHGQLSEVGKDAYMKLVNSSM